MNIVVCVKRVPDLAEAEIVIDKNGKAILQDDLDFDINEWDSYAVEEAVQLKEKLGGTVTAVTLGDEDSEEVLRRALAVGADHAVRLTDDAFAGGDAYATAKTLAAYVRSLPFDLVLTGAQSGDDGSAQVGATLAELLGLPHATLVTEIEIDCNLARVHRELEAGQGEMLEIQLPAVFTIQTGINEPRYVSIAGIRRVARREIEVLGARGIGLSPDEVGAKSSRIQVLSLALPPMVQRGEILAGSVDTITEKLGSIFASKGWLT